jgi:hypothetical protein
MLTRLCVRLQSTRSLVHPQNSRRQTSSQARHAVETDSCGIPVRPTWSVNKLISSYPSPSISPTTFKHLHALSALIPPREGSPEYEGLKRELEDLVKLVEAVRLVDVEGSSKDDKVIVRDGRIWAQGTGIPLLQGSSEDGEDIESGEALLHHAARTSTGFYVVDAERTR